MNQYERRFYEDIHKLVIIQGKILKELEKMNKPLQEIEPISTISSDEEWEEFLKITNAEIKENE